MNRKQIGALLKIASKDASRPVLTSVHVDVYEGKTCLVATDGYILAMRYLEGIDSHVGETIPRKLMERWYKLADNKSWFDAETVDEMFTDKDYKPSDYKYPNYKSLIPTSNHSTNRRVNFNAELALALQKVSGKPGLEWEFYGEREPITAKDETGIYLLMPLIK